MKGVSKEKKNNEEGTKKQREGLPKLRGGGEASRVGVAGDKTEEEEEEEKDEGEGTELEGKKKEKKRQERKERMREVRGRKEGKERGEEKRGKGGYGAVLSNYFITWEKTSPCTIIREHFVP